MECLTFLQHYANGSRFISALHTLGNQRLPYPLSCNLRVLESAYPPPLSTPVPPPPPPACGPIVLAVPNESHVGTAVHTKTRELALRVSLITLPSHSTRCTPILLP